MSDPPPEAGEAPRRRRTQAERRATTRAALLDAALALLVEEGYAGMTTRKVAERAGVSQGTQMHYFPTREAFVAEAIRHVAARIDAELREQDALTARSETRRLEEVLDRLWEVHCGPVFQVAMELWVAARTDPQVRTAMNEAIHDVTRMIVLVADDLFAELMSQPRAYEVLELALASIRGLALLRFTFGPDDVQPRWERTRAHLLEACRRL